AEPGVLAGADDVLDAGVDAVRRVDVGALAQPALRVRGPVGDPQGVAPPVFSWSPPGPSRSSPVSSATWASSIQQAWCAQRRSAQAPSERRSRTSPLPSTAISQAASGTLPIAVLSRAPSA